MRRVVLPIALLLLVVIEVPSLRAQTASDTVRPSMPQASLDAASELLRLLQMEAVMQASMRSMLDAQVEAQPMLAPFHEVMMTWAQKHFTWDKVGDRFVVLYAEAFTEAELREMIAFYHTPTGRKLAAMTPDLTRRGAEIGAAIAEENMADLEAMIQARAKELQGPPQER